MTARLGASLLLAGLLALLGATPAQADAAQPAYLSLEEIESRRFTVHWRVPWHQGRILSIRPLLPEGFEEVGPRERSVTRAGLQERWIVQAPPWQGAEETLAVEGLGASVAETLIRIRFQDGSTATRVLSPGSPTCDMPRPLSEAGEDGPDTPAIVAHATRAGATHVQHSILLVLLLLAMVWTWPGAAGVRATGAFLIGQLLGVGLSAFVTWPLALPPTYAWLGIAAAYLLTRRLVATDAPAVIPIPLLLGLAHAASWSAGVDMPLAGRLAFVLGMDLAFLLGAFALGILLPRLGTGRARRVLVYATASVATAFALGSFFATPEADARASYRANLQSLVEPTLSTDPASQALGTGSNATFQLFAQTEVDRIRVQVLFPASELPGGLPGGAAIPIAAQQGVKDRGSLYAMDLFHISRGNVPLDLTVDATWFVTTGIAGVLERPEPVEEPILTARLGISLSAALPEEGADLIVMRNTIVDQATMSLTIVGPEGAETYELTEASPTTRWHAVPRAPEPVQAVRREGRTRGVPLVSCLLAIAGVVFLLAWRGRATRWRDVARARVAFALAGLLATHGMIEMTFDPPDVPSEPRARAIAEAIVSNVYRALAVRDEAQAYDRLAVSVAGDLRAHVYLEQRRTLDLEGRGGARARVESVEVTDLDALKAVPGGFEADVTWTAAGSVVHFGHRHLRRNNYRARLRIQDDAGAWKLSAIDVLELERVR